MSFQVNSNWSPEHKLMNVVIKQLFWLKMDGTWDRRGCNNRICMKSAQMTGRRLCCRPAEQHFWSTDFTQSKNWGHKHIIFLIYTHCHHGALPCDLDHNEGKGEKHEWKPFMDAAFIFSPFTYFPRAVWTYISFLHPGDW